MWKWFGVTVVAILISAVVSVTRYDEIHDTEGKGYEVKCVQSNDQSATAPYLVCTIEHSQKTKNGEYQPVWWHVFLAWPEGVTALLLMLTLGAIIWQARETREAAQAALISANAAVAQIEFVKNKERAQLSIEFDPLNLVYDQEADGYPVRFRVILDGTTRATILHESIAAYLADSPGTKRIAWEPLGLPGTFRPESSPFPSVIFIQTDDDVTENERDRERIDLVRSRKLDVYVTGRVLYRDLFDDEWELGIDREWHQWGGWYGGEGQSSGTWAKAGNGKGDYHRKVEKPRKPN
jgi:hypothetical protein